ncbi:hypothetical protein U1Q18_032357 [Sarracenia purpurea var. burkii]
MLEDALLLLQTGEHLAIDAFCRESIGWSDDRFSSSKLSFSGEIATMVDQPLIPTITETETVSQLLSRIKFHLRRKTAAIASLDAGLHSEAIRHFSNIVEGRRGAPQDFLTECYIYRASAYRSVG